MKCRVTTISLEDTENFKQLQSNEFEVENLIFFFFSSAHYFSFSAGILWRSKKYISKEIHMFFPLF